MYGMQKTLVRNWVPTHNGILFGIFSDLRSMRNSGSIIIDHAFTKLNRASETGCSGMDGTIVMPMLFRNTFT